MKALVLSLAFLALLSAFLAAPATACDGVQAFYGGYSSPFVLQFSNGQQYAVPYHLGFSQPVYSVHQPFAFRQSFNHGFRKQIVSIGGHRQQVIVNRNGLFNRQRIVVRH